MTRKIVHVILAVLDAALFYRMCRQHDHQDVSAPPSPAFWYLHGR